jgi:hypothetical protein
MKDRPVSSRTARIIADDGVYGAERTGQMIGVGIGELNSGHMVKFGTGD